MDFMYEPIETDEPTGFEPLDLDDEEFDDDEDDIYYFEADYYDDEDDDDYEDPSFGGFDDLRPFGSFDDGYGWDDPLF